MVALGFNKIQADQALIQANGNINMATDLLFQQQDPYSGAASSQPSHQAG